jgi:hypothetical protein
VARRRAYDSVNSADANERLSPALRRPAADSPGAARAPAGRDRTCAPLRFIARGDWADARAPGEVCRPRSSATAARRLHVPENDQLRERCVRRVLCICCVAPSLMQPRAQDLRDRAVSARRDARAAHANRRRGRRCRAPRASTTCPWASAARRRGEGRRRRRRERGRGQRIRGGHTRRRVGTADAPVRLRRACGARRACADPGRLRQELLRRTRNVVLAIEEAENSPDDAASGLRLAGATGARADREGSGTEVAWAWASVRGRARSALGQ